MDELQLRALLSNDPVTKPYFSGITSHDKLWKLSPTHPVFYVVNTDYSFNNGIHWTVIYLDKNSEFFDSLGKPPKSYDDNFTDFLIVNGLRYIFSIKQVQSSSSSLCGEFCVYFAHHRCSGYTFIEIIDMFSDNLKLNDKKVEDFVKRLYKSYFVV